MPPGPTTLNGHRPVSEFERLLPTFNKVQDICNRIGVSADIHLPQVVVVGAQVSNLDSELLECQLGALCSL